MTDDVVLGDTLAILSLKVAQEVDRKSKGRGVDTSLLAQFSKELSRASGIGEPNSIAFLHSDPITTEVFTQAIRESSTEPISDISSLGTAVMKIIEPLRKTGEALQDRDLASIKAFCLSLHKSMMAQRLPPLVEDERSFEDELRFVR